MVGEGDRLGFPGADEIATQSMKRGSGRIGHTRKIEIDDKSSGIIFALFDSDMAEISRVIDSASGELGPQIAGKAVTRIVQTRKRDTSAIIERQGKE